MPALASPRGAPLARALAAHGAAAVVLVLTRHAPSFVGLGARAGLFAWVLSLTAITALVPAAVLFVGFRSSRKAVGLTWGKTRRDAPWLAVGVIGAALLGYLLSRLPDVKAHYPHYAFVRADPVWWIPSVLAFAAYSLSWETLFRGHLLLGSRDALGRWALFTQAAMFALGHADKPAVELALSLPAGLFFGLVALRTGSVLPGFFLHVAVSVSVNVSCVYG